MFQKKECKDWIIESGIEEHADADQTPDVGIRSTAGFGWIHCKKWKFATDWVTGGYKLASYLQRVLPRNRQAVSSFSCPQLQIFYGFVPTSKDSTPFDPSAIPMPGPLTLIDWLRRAPAFQMLFVKARSVHPAGPPF